MGRNLLRACTRKPKTITRSREEAELYAASLGASEAKGVENMVSDLVFVVKPVLILDAKGNRAQSAPTWTRKNETHGRGEFEVAR